MIELTQAQVRAIHAECPAVAVNPQTREEFGSSGERPTKLCRAYFARS